WIRRSLAEEKPYDQFARELVTATGNTFTNGPANFYRVARTPAEQGEQVAQIFLGIRLQCAQCHNHPFEKWTRTRYHQFAALFARVQSKGQNNTGFEVALQEKGEYRSPETNRPLAPVLLADTPVDFPADADRRAVLATW